MVFHGGRISHATQVNRRHLKGEHMRGLKTLLGSTALLAGLALAPAAHAQVVVGIGIQPVCSYGYYEYSPYACAPSGYYGPGYFYNGIFLGMGPWAGWGYGHGWGSHRFVSDGGGRYHGGGGEAASRGQNAGGSRPMAGRPAVVHASASHATASHARVSREAAPHARPSRQAAPHAGPSREAAPHASAAHASAPHGHDDPK
jgi:hypothetical protein